jgi:hypothetical protein
VRVCVCVCVKYIKNFYARVIIGDTDIKKTTGFFFLSLLPRILDNQSVELFHGFLRS